jgi:hypothetical protein
MDIITLLPKDDICSQLRSLFLFQGSWYNRRSLFIRMVLFLEEQGRREREKPNFLVSSTNFFLMPCAIGAMITFCVSLYVCMYVCISIGAKCTCSQLLNIFGAWRFYQDAFLQHSLLWHSIFFFFFLSLMFYD